LPAYTRRRSILRACGAHGLKLRGCWALAQAIWPSCDPRFYWGFEARDRRGFRYGLLRLRQPASAMPA